jgi:hypothetical protein
MSPRNQYRKRAAHAIVAVKINLDTDGLAYRKWGGNQHAKRGDWLVENNGETYTIDGKVFARTYKRLRPGVYVKTTPIWAEVARQAGSVATKEGESRYKRGDYLVYNEKNGGDGYCMSAAKFKAMYKRVR